MAPNVDDHETRLRILEKEVARLVWEDAERKMAAARSDQWARFRLGLGVTILIGVVPLVTVLMQKAIHP